MFGMRSWRSLAAALFTVLLVSCGGGGGDAGCSVYATDCDGSGGGGGTVEASDLSIVVSSDQLDNSGATAVTVTVTAVDEGRRALAGIPVSVSVDSEAVATVSGDVTDDKGVVTAQVGPGSDKSSRTITVRAVSGELSRTASIRVSGAKLVATAVPSVVNAGTTGNQIQYRLTDKAGNAIRNQPITVSLPGQADQSGVTGNSGEYNFVYTAPNVASTTLVSISGVSAGESSTIEVSVQASSAVNIPVVNPAVTPVVSASVEAVPNVVGVNEVGSTSNRAEIRALFRTTSNAPVKNIRVRFDLDGDQNSIGGTFLSGGSLVYTDAEGAALTAYVPGTRSSPTNGVTVRACWDYADFVAPACPNAATSTLTVASEAINVRISTNELIKSGRNDLSYIKEYLITVTDSAGNPKGGVTVTPSVDLLYYIKGPNWRWNGKEWVRNTTANFPNDTLATNPEMVGSYLACINEDANRNNVLDIGLGEDFNNDGELWPRKADVLISMVGGTTTDPSGRAIVQIEYGRSLATWTQFKMTVTAGGIGGTEGRDTYVALLPVSSAAATTEAPPAPWVVGPYGRNVTNCADPN